MTINLENLDSLLLTTQRIASHEEEIKRLRGETFNIFSILKVESRENGTHSAFLGELLNPKGSHLCGNIFLKHFLDVVAGTDKLNASTATVQLEVHIGARSDASKTGGRVDIYLSDSAGRSICIENKIYASDQAAQIERYANHNAGKNTVYYLTLYGIEASEGSRGALKATEHYHCISYRHTIIAWLERCIKDAVEQPILRETIRQYIILLKNLTHQLTDRNMEKQIHDLIVRNYSAAKLIADNLPTVEQEAVHSFLTEVKKRIEKELNDGCEIVVDADLYASWAGLQLSYKKWNGLHIRLQGEPKLIGGRSIYGIVANKNSWDRSGMKAALAPVAILQQGFSDSAWWAYFKNINLFQTDADIMHLFDAGHRARLIDDVTEKLVSLAQACSEPLASIKPL